MNERLTDVSLALILGWLCWGLVSLFVGGALGLPVGLVLGAGAAILLRQNMVVRGLAALLEPIGIVLPLLMLRHMLGAVGVSFAPFGALELFAFILFYSAFLICTFELMPFDPYRVGYRALPVGGMVLALCAYAALSGHGIIAVIAVAGQAAWVLRIGSSNYFDHILHVSLLPVAVVVLIARMIGL
ncbi:hypothetical protein [Roseovarius faecimaris]|nr:hypothetical protein [Roseovarius faecimaris]